uniref:Uncharacterized protein n=1 Tax=Glossina palpalis gambiensis TaxID=67801 RepID=A0A1B0C6D3_9MUSC
EKSGSHVSLSASVLISFCDFTTSHRTIGNEFGNKLHSFQKSVSKHASCTASGGRWNMILYQILRHFTFKFTFPNDNCGLQTIRQRRHTSLYLKKAFDLSSSLVTQAWPRIHASFYCFKILGMEMIVEHYRITISQTANRKKLSEKFNRVDAKSWNHHRPCFLDKTPKNCVDVSYLCRLLDKGQCYCDISRLQYGTITDKLARDCFTNSDFADDLESRHTASGSLILLANAAIYRSSKRHHILAPSTAEADGKSGKSVYKGGKELIWR